MGRRVRGEGTIFFDKNRQEYVGNINNGTKPDGKPNRIVFYSGKGGTQSDVLKKMQDWRLRNDPNYVKSNRIRLEDGIKAWLETCKKSELKPSSYDRLESTIDCQVIPRIGDRYIDELTDSMIQKELISAIIDDDGLAVSSGKKAYDALNAYLKYAAQKKMIPFNPMGTMKAPRPSSTIEITPDMYIMDDSEKALSKEETEKLRGILYYRWKRKPHNRRYPNGGAMDLILNTGLRMGEALALQWSDINFEKKTLSVTKNLIRIKNRDGKGNKYKLIIQDQPKTTKSRRVLPLNAAAIAALEDLKTTPGYKPRGFIIHTDNGSAMEPRNFEATLGLMCKAAGIREVGVHALRHTYATRLFEKGVDIKIISELLGHSSTEITYRIYVHVIESLKASAVEGLDLY
jgi:integrase